MKLSFVLPTEKRDYKYYLFFISLFQFTFSYSQLDSKELLYNNWFDNTIGIENTGLYNGVQYFSKYRVINENHQFLISDYFMDGTIIYGGQIYDQVKIGYDIYQDEVLLEIEKTLGKVPVKTIKERVQAFYIADRKFVNLNVLKDNIVINGFHEVLLDITSFVLYKKHILKTAKISDEGTFYYEFLPGKDKYYLLYNDEYYLVDKAKDLAEIFPQFKKEINRYYDRNLHKTDKDSSLKLLVSRIHQLYLDTESFKSE